MTAEEIAHRLAQVAFDKVYLKVFKHLIELTPETGTIVDVNFSLEIHGNLIKVDGGYESYEEEKVVS